MKKTFIPAVFFLTAVFTFCTVQTVHSQERTGQLIQSQYYDEWEADYLAQTRRVLEQYGLTGGGITMTRTVESDGSRCYAVAVHHRRAALLTGEEQEQLKEALESIYFPETHCKFTHYLSA